MRHFVYTLFVLFFITACGNQPDSERMDTLNVVQSIDTVSKQHQDKNDSRYTEFALGEKIIIDLNGDNHPDTAFMESIGPENKTIFIVLGGDSIRIALNCEDEEGIEVDDFNWVTNWAIGTVKTMRYTKAVNGVLQDCEMEVENPSIILWQDGGGRGFFTFKGGKWIWRTTGC